MKTPVTNVTYASDRKAQTAAPSTAAERALAEAAARRAAHKRDERPKELQGRGGLDPVRYGDWEVKGLASDF